MSNVRLTAERVGILLFSIISEGFRQALEDPSESLAEQLGVSWESLQDVSEALNQHGRMNSLIQLRDVHYGWCSPPPCDFAPDELEECLEQLVMCFEYKLGHCCPN